MEELLKNAHESVYKLVILASRRALELGTGSEKLVECDNNTKLTTIALREIMEKKVSYKLKKK
ncbi:MAG: DNA-directed RNA polymerase subunit omega [Candidatus Omnitrophota bacterium]